MEAYEQSKTFECEDYIVVARYNADANIPDEAALLVEQITSDSDGEHYGDREAEYREMTGDADASMRALLKIGFYDENGEEIEPVTPVNVAVQFLDEDGLAEGKPITIIHFAEEGTEKLNGSNAKNNSTTFKMESFSEIAIGYGEEEESRIGEDGKVHLSDSFKYKDDAFQITFHVEGEAVPVEGSSLKDIEVQDTELEGEENEDGAESTAPSEGENAVEDNEDKEASLDMEEVNEMDASEEPSQNETDEMDEEKLEFVVEPLNEESEEYIALAAYADDMDELDELLRMQLLSYSLTFEGVELDLSECEVTAEVTTTRKLQQYMEESLPEAVSYLASNEAVISEINELEANTDEDKIDVEPIAENSVENEVDTADDLKVVGDNVTEEASETDGTEILVYGDVETNIEEEELELKDTTEIVVAIAELSEDNEVNEVENMVLSEETKFETMQFSLSRNMFALRSSTPGDANPTFKVEYYANLKKVVRSGGTGTELNVINTSNKSTSTSNKGNGKGALPQNGNGLTNSPNGNALQKIFLNDKGVVQTKLTPTKVYATKSYEYKKAPSLMYFDSLIGNPGYKVVEVWVKYETDPSINGEGFKPSGITPDKDGWYKYNYNATAPNLHFTNRRLTAEQEKNYVFINKGATIRLVYNTVEKKENPFDAKFYDYNITGGKTGDVWNTAQQGINVKDNYKSSGAKYAFGNANCGTGLDTQKWDSNYINRYNRTSQGGNDSYQGCVFGLVNGIEGNDKNGYNVKFSVEEWQW